MGKINVLGFDVANLIAAGEVVDRPASAVKELLENAIDAGAENITVEIRAGGTKLIRVTDDGCGISADDLPLSVLRHATSKISDASDLAEIMTLGFRGEALAAIAAVTRMRIVSKTSDSPFGSQLTVNCGEIVDLTETGCPDGTTVICEDLFSNVPARRKFLKKDTTETAAVTGVVEKIALGCPWVSIKYVTDGEIKFHTPGNSDMLGVIYVIYGRDISGRIKHISREENGIKAEGYISEPDFFRPNRNMQNFFINHRYVKSRTMAAAVEQAYTTRIPADKFPFCAIELTVNPEAVDVNVHPSKLEVKFTNERLVFEAVYYAVLSGLEASGSMPEMKLETRGHNLADTPVPRPASSPSPSKTTSQNNGGNKSFWVTGEEAIALMNSFVTGDKNKGEQISIRSAGEKTGFISYAPKSGGDNAQGQETASGDIVSSNAPKVSDATDADLSAEIKEHNITPCNDEADGADKNTEESKRENPEAVPEYVIIGEAYNCYIVVQLEDRLIFIDKHAAHERIIFDSLCEKMNKKEKHSQMLMFPLKVTLTDNEADALSEYKEKINAVGFEFSCKGKETEITAIPEEITREAAADMLVSLASSLSEAVGTIESVGAEYFDARLYQASCKAAIKGGRIYSSENLRWICDRILRTPVGGESAVKTCPHGRPVAFELKRNTIERQFQRLV